MYFGEMFKKTISSSALPMPTPKRAAGLRTLPCPCSKERECREAPPRSAERTERAVENSCPFLEVSWYLQHAELVSERRGYELRTEWEQRQLQRVGKAQVARVETIQVDDVGLERAK